MARRLYVAITRYPNKVGHLAAHVAFLEDFSLPAPHSVSTEIPDIPVYIRRDL
jgi:hypothetical protein